MRLIVEDPDDFDSNFDEARDHGLDELLEEPQEPLPPGTQGVSWGLVGAGAGAFLIGAWETVRPLWFAWRAGSAQALNVGQIVFGGFILALGVVLLRIALPRLGMLKREIERKKPRLWLVDSQGSSEGSKDQERWS